MCYSAMVEKDLEAIGALLDWELTHQMQTEAELPDRIYPGDQAAVLCFENNSPTLMAMTYGAHGPSWMQPEQVKKLTTYNSRRDSLQKAFWSESVGVHHGIVLMKGFFEWVTTRDLLRAKLFTMEQLADHLGQLAIQRRERLESQGKKWRATVTEKKPITERKVIIQIKAQIRLWTPVLISQRAAERAFAIITDEPSKRLLNAGHDRQPIAIQRNDLKAWLRPERSSPAEWQKWLARIPEEELDISLSS